MAGPEGPKNPWGKGDEYEKQLEPEEVQRIRDRVSAESLEKRYQNQGLEEMMISDFREDLHEAGGTYTETYQVDGAGNIVEPDMFNGPDLLSCTSTTLRKVEGGLTYWFLPDDVRIAAAEITKRNPDIVFTFDEDRNKGTFTYTATLQEKKE